MTFCTEKALSNLKYVGQLDILKMRRGAANDEKKEFQTILQVIVSRLAQMIAERTRKQMNV